MFTLNNAFSFVVAIGLLTLFTGCKNHNNSTPEVEITIFGSNDPDSKGDTIAVFDTPWGRPLDLNKAEHVQFQEPPIGYRTDYIHDESNDKEIYVFQAVKYNSSYSTYITSYTVKTPENNPKIKVQKGPHSSLSQNEVINFYLFFINGIGDRPSSPVEISYIPLDEDFEEIPGRKTVYLDPNKHTIPNNITLSKNWRNLNIDQNSELYLRFNIKQLSVPSDYQPLILTRGNTQERWFISSYSTGDFSFYRRIPVSDEFELFMYTIDRNQLTR